jgi:hypothetical protein
MLGRKLQSWFYPEPTGDVGRDRNARTLQFTCLLFAFAIALVAVLDTITQERVEFPILVLAVVALVVAAARNRAGRSAWANHRPDVGFWASRKHARARELCRLEEAEQRFHRHGCAGRPSVYLLRRRRTREGRRLSRRMERLPATVKKLVEYCNTEFTLPSVGSPNTGIHKLGPEQKLHKHTERPGDHDQLPSA